MQLIDHYEQVPRSSIQVVSTLLCVGFGVVIVDCTLLGVHDRNLPHHRETRRLKESSRVKERGEK
jgi:hypothetical protein